MSGDPGHVRAWLDKRCFNTSQLRSLLQDHFSDVARELPSVATMSQMLNTLFDTHPADEIARRLERLGYRAPTPAEVRPGCDLLIVTAEPRDRPSVRTAAELGTIQRSLGAWSTVVLHNARFEELVDALREHRPRVLHFTGHGDEQSKDLLLVDKAGDAQPIAKRAVADALARAPGVELVVLNACFSHEQAVELRRCVRCAIGMKRRVSNDAAIAFSERFYELVARGDLIKGAFEEAVERVGAAADQQNEKHVFQLTWGVDTEEDEFRLLGAGELR